MIQACRAELQGAHERLVELLGSAGESADVEALTTLLSNVAHLFVYAEGNHRYVDVAQLAQWRDELLDGAAVRQRVLSWLTAARCADDAAAELRRRWTTRLAQLVEADDGELAQQEQQVCADVDDALRRIVRERGVLLTRLGADPGDAAPEAVFFRMISTTSSAPTRAKLARAWERPAQAVTDDLVALGDQLVDIRRRRARQADYRTPAMQTLDRCSISRDHAESFVAEYLACALVGHERLGRQVRQATGCTDDPMNHFAFYLRSRTSGRMLPDFPLERCLALACAVTAEVSGCAVRTEFSGEQAVVLALDGPHGSAGRIRVDLQGAVPGVEADPCATPALDLRTPVGRALGRYRAGADGQRVMTFEAAHSLFHEFGHALTQVLLGFRQPSLSGLEYLPVERLEDLSEWFEKWVYHPEFGRSMPGGGAGLATCQQIKRLEFLSTHLQRAVAAALDFAVHDSEHDGLQACFDRLDAHHGVGRYCELGELVGYFARPMFRANPGLALVYPWGYAYGTARFAPVLKRGVQDVSGALLPGGALESCLDSELPSDRTDPAAVLRWYEDGLIEPESERCER